MQGNHRQNDKAIEGVLYNGTNRDYPDANKETYGSVNDDEQETSVGSAKRDPERDEESEDNFNSYLSRSYNHRGTAMKVI